MNKKKNYLILIFLIALFGIGLASILTIAKYSDNVAALCGEDVDNSCNTVQNSAFANIVSVEQEDGGNFSIPLSVLGIVFYILILVGSIYMYRTKKIKNRIKQYFILLIIIGVISSIILTGMQIFLLDAYCTYCLFSALDTGILAVVTLLYFKE